jgi:hypothetical protein
MELFTKLFGSLLLFVYHCFDRVVIHGYLSGLSRPGQVEYFFRTVLDQPVLSKEVLCQRSRDYQTWVESYARNHQIAIEWAGKGVRKEDYIAPQLARMQRQHKHGVYFIFKSMEQGNTFRSAVPRYPTQDPNFRILAKQRSRFTHYYFYIHDEVLGPIVLRVASFFPFQTTYWLNGHSFMEKVLLQKGVSFRKKDNAFLTVADSQALQEAADSFTPQVIRPRLEYWTFLLGPKFSRKERQAMNLSRFYSISQVEYCRNFIFKRHFPIHKIFERSCEIGLWRVTANKISEMFGTRLTKKLKGKLSTTLEQIQHGHHVFRAYCRNSFLKQYEKWSAFLRNELCSNNLAEFGLKKGLDHLAAVRTKFLEITDRFAGFQAQGLNVHADFPLLQKLALPVLRGKVRFPGIKIHDTRMIRLLEVFLHGSTQVVGWRAPQLLQAVLQAYRLSPTTYSLNQLRYDLRKLKGQGLIQRDGQRYAYRLTPHGTRVALLFLLFHQRLCGPLAHSLFHHRPEAHFRPTSKLEAAYHKADDSIHRIIQLLEAA